MRDEERRRAMRISNEVVVKRVGNDWGDSLVAAGKERERFVA